MVVENNWSNVFYLYNRIFYDVSIIILIKLFFNFTAENVILLKIQSYTSQVSLIS